MTNAQMIRRAVGRRLAAARWRRCDALRAAVLEAVAHGNAAEAGRYTRELVLETGLARWTAAKAEGRPFVPAPSAHWPDWTDATRSRGRDWYV